MSQSIEATPAQLQEQALVRLGEVCRDLERAQLNKIHFIRLARRHGCTLEQVAAEIGVTEAAVRAMIKRADAI